MRVTFLEYRTGTESLFTSGLRSGAQAAGWKTSTVFLRDLRDTLYPQDRIRSNILKSEPDLIFFLMDAPLDLPDLWDDPDLQVVPKRSLWFDDYYRSPKTLALPNVWRQWNARFNVQVGIWDPFWRKEWEAFTGFEAFPIALAANPASFKPDAGPWLPEWKDRAVFVGTIPSLESLDDGCMNLSSPLRLMLKSVLQILQTGPWPIRPYETARTVLEGLNSKIQQAIHTALEDPMTLAFWNHLLWRWGKRIARLRGLTAVGNAGPIGILSGHGTESYANESDLRMSLPPHLDWVYTDTRCVPSSNWSSLFKTGMWQFQITDPQSIEGGIPFRLFECGASSVPLLSDSRPELVERFGNQPGLILAANEKELTAQALRLFSLSAVDHQTAGYSLHRAFLKDHTWQSRWMEITAASSS